MNAYTGQPATALVAKLGYPTRQDTVAGHAVYVWTFGGLSEGTSYGCTIRAILDDQNTITSWDYRGNNGACLSYAARLAN